MRSTPTHRIAERRLAVLAALAALAVLLVVPGGEGASRREEAVQGARWSGLVGAERPRVPLGQRQIVVLRAPSLADRVHEAGGRATENQMREWSAAALANQKQFAARVASKGVLVRPEFSYTRVVNAFSTALDPRALAVLERDEQVVGVYPVRAAFPASLSSGALAQSAFADGSGHRPSVRLPGTTGAGVTVALLDTGVDRTHPYLRERVLEGFDILDPDRAPNPRAHPDVPGLVERHGTQLAGIVAGADGPAGLHGVAPEARILPIRVAGWQPDAQGGSAIYGRTDQLLAGLERAVDPNDDGDAHDAVRIALIGVVEPFAAFADGAVARAVEGATRLGMLVVVPAGNDGPAGPAYGSIGGPGGAPAALTVGAADERPAIPTVSVVVRAGLRVLVDERLPLGGAVAPARPLTLEVGAPRSPDASLPPDRRPLASYFDERGFGLVAGHAALVPAAARPLDAQIQAAQAGASAVLLEGVAPAGSLGLDERVPVPVVGLPVAAAQELRAALAAGVPVTVSIGVPGGAANPRVSTTAPFSSRGLAFAGGVKPELAAPGIAVATSEPGRNDDGTARYGTINGTSAAAAVTAGTAALLAEGRSRLDAAGLRGVLVGTSHRPREETLSEAGGALVDVAAASAAEVAADPATISFGAVLERGTTAVRTLRVLNTSNRRLRVRVDPTVEGVAGVTITVQPRNVLVLAGRSAEVKVTARVSLVARRLGAIEGAIRLRPVGTSPVRVPWAVAFPSPPDGLLGDVRLSAPTFRAADTAPSVLTLRAGRLRIQSGTPVVEPVEALEVELWRGGERVGTLARLRDLLPGRYSFGLTGRGPLGRRLATGRYTLKVLAYPAAGGEPAVETVSFTLR